MLSLLSLSSTSERDIASVFKTGSFMIVVRSTILSVTGGTISLTVLVSKVARVDDVVSVLVAVVTRVSPTDSVAVATEGVSFFFENKAITELDVLAKKELVLV